MGQCKKKNLNIERDSNIKSNMSENVTLPFFVEFSEKNLDPFLGRNFALFAEERVIYKSQRNICHATSLDLDPIIFEFKDSELRTKTKN